MMKHIKKIGAMALAGAVIASGVTAAVAFDKSSSDVSTTTSTTTTTLMQAHDQQVKETVLKDVEQPETETVEKTVKYSMLGC